MQSIPWIVVGAATLAGFALAALVGLWWLRRPRKPVPLPTEWSLASRPVFSTDERRVYRLLREALPHHIVLSKLPLVRFSQPIDPGRVRFWYELLGSIHVTFAVCSANGRVLAAVDLDTDRGNSRRVLQIKQSVLGACRVRYLRCPVDHLPSVAELQLLVPQSGGASRGPQAVPPPASLDQARDTLSSTVANRRAERTALWQDSSLFQDSFFAPDTRADGFSGSEFGSLAGPRQAPGPTESARHGDAGGDDIGGVVVDNPRYSANSRF
ncbi:MAG: DUF2726 domain-containing protein [Piscinibacter sp.]|nr:DUF2726 domain-containing protein [Piscinibacter sp.]